LHRDVATSKIRLFLIAVTPANPDPRIAWVRAHCVQQGTPNSVGPVSYVEFSCSR
jgi:hypothetical protein